MSFQLLLDRGRSLRTLANRLVNLHRRLGCWESTMRFLSDCVDLHLVPRGLRLNIHSQSREEERWKGYAESKRVVAASKAARRTFYRIRGEIGETYTRLQEACPPDAVAVAMDTARRIYFSSLREANRTKGNKFANILAEKPLIFSSRRPMVPPPDITSTVINLSVHPLSQDAKIALCHGGRFSVPPSRFPVAELAVRGQYIAEVAQKKAAELDLTGEQIAEYHNRAAAVVSKSAKAAFPPLPPTIKRGLRNLETGDRVVVPADKARSLVVLDKADYTAAVLRTLQTEVYKEVPTDPAKTFAAKFGDVLLTAFSGHSKDGRGDRRDRDMRAADEDKYKAYRRLLRSHGRCGPYYGLIKTHKYDRPPSTEEERHHWVSTLKLRPICPGYRSCDYDLARHLTAVLQLLPRPPLSIQSPLEVLERLEEYGYAAGSCRLLSLDVEAMFPSVPIYKAIPLIRGLLHQHAHRLPEISYLSPDSVADLLLLSISNTHAVFNDGVRDRYWVQQKGLAMGKSYSPVVADLYMGSWERDLKERAVQAGGAVVFALRYADDFLVAFRGDDDAVARWLEELNSKEAAIKVTLELEVDGQLPFLDIRIQRSEFGFCTSVYRKPCNTGQVVPFNSFTDPKYLQNAIAADVLRALKYCREEGVRREELRHIRAKFAAYGYPGSFIDAVVAKTFHAEEIKSRALPAPGAAPSQPRLAVPYFGPGFHALRREAGKLGIMLVAKPLSTVASSLCSRPKHRLPKEQMVDVVYLIKCSCDSIYIGESERELQTRVSEHRRGREKEDRGTAFGGHKACQPGPDFEGAQVLATESHYRLRLLLESAMIRWRGGRETVIRSPNDISLNRNAGALISERWLPLLRALPPPQSQN